VALLAGEIVLVEGVTEWLGERLSAFNYLIKGAKDGFGDGFLEQKAVIIHLIEKLKLLSCHLYSPPQH
jgi:hypothetical protein